jgi:hypothetical protein
MRCLEKHREQRFGDVKELRAALLAATVPDAAAQPPRPESVPPTALAPGSGAASEPDLAPPKRRRWLVPAAAALWLIVVAFAVQICSRPAAPPPLATPQSAPRVASPLAQVAKAHAEEGVVSIDALPIEKPSEAPHRGHAVVPAPPTTEPAPSAEPRTASRPRTPEELLRDRK